MSKSISQKSVDIAPPNNIEAEEAVLGSMLIDPDSIPKLQEILKPEDFFVVRNGWVFSAILECKEGPDVITVSQKLASKNLLQEVGGEVYLTNLLVAVANALNVIEYANIVREMAIRRNQLNYASNVAIRAYALDIPLNDAQESNERKLAEISRTIAGINPTEIDDDLLGRLTKNFNAEAGISGYKTGFPRIDNLSGGLKENLRMLAAREGVGKTSYALCEIGELLRQKTPVGIISLETTVTDLKLMLASIELRQDFSGRTKWSDSVWDAVTLFNERISHKPLKIYTHQHGPHTAAAIVAVAKEWAKTGTKVIYIDNLSAIKWGTNVERRDLVIGDFMTELKAICAAHSVHITVIGHINREGIRSKMPDTDNIADSSAPGKLAAIVHLMWPDTSVEGLKHPRYGPYAVTNHAIRKGRGGITGQSCTHFFFTQYRHLECDTIPLN